LYIELDPKILDFKETPLCMPATKHITIKNTHTTEVLDIKSIFSESMMLEIKDNP